MIGISKNTGQKLLSFLQIHNSGNFGVAGHVASFLRKLLGFNDNFLFWNHNFNHNYTTCSIQVYK